jgi:hypothetical protein
MNSIPARDSLPVRRDQPVRFPFVEQLAKVVETAVQRRDIDGH